MKNGKMRLWNSRHEEVLIEEGNLELLGQATPWTNMSTHLRVRLYVSKYPPLVHGINSGWHFPSSRRVWRRYFCSSRGGVQCLPSLYCRRLRLGVGLALLGHLGIPWYSPPLNPGNTWQIPGNWLGNSCRWRPPITQVSGVRNIYSITSTEDSSGSSPRHMAFFKVCVPRKSRLSWWELNIIVF